MNTKFWSGNLKGRDDSENPNRDGRIILKCILDKKGGKVWTGFMGLRIEGRGGLL
jgi:hypothetical protein